MDESDLQEFFRRLNELQDEFEVRLARCCDRLMIIDQCTLKSGNVTWLPNGHLALEPGTFCLR